MVIARVWDTSDDSDNHTSNYSGNETSDNESYEYSDHESYEYSESSHSDDECTADLEIVVDNAEADDEPFDIKTLKELKRKSLTLKSEQEQNQSNKIKWTQEFGDF
jgi:hypothetical protein